MGPESKEKTKHPVIKAVSWVGIISSISTVALIIIWLFTGINNAELGAGLFVLMAIIYISILLVMLLISLFELSYAKRLSIENNEGPSYIKTLGIGAISLIISVSFTGYYMHALYFLLANRSQIVEMTLVFIGIIFLFSIVSLILGTDIIIRCFRAAGRWKIISIISLVLLAVGGTCYYFGYKSELRAEIWRKGFEEQAIKERQAELDYLEKKKSSSSTATPGSATSATTALTNDQIFQEASTQLSLTRSRLNYFKIYGQDKISYSTNEGAAGTSSGPLFAYKTSGKWHIVPGTGSSDVATCSEFTSVPENYRPMCYQGETLMYANSNRSSTNYPESQSVSYIGD